MPTPIAHSLLGLSVGLAYTLPRGSWGDLARAARKKMGVLVFAVVVSNLPDMDYLPGLLSGYLNSYHHYYTHTVFWMVLMGGGLYLCQRALMAGTTGRDMAFIVSLLALHLLADWVTADGLAPYGMMLAWPWSDRFTLSPVSLFPKTEKLSVADLFSAHNFRVALYETAVGCFCLAGVVAWKWRREPGRQDRIL